MEHVIYLCNLPANQFHIYYRLQKVASLLDPDVFQLNQQSILESDQNFFHNRFRSKKRSCLSLSDIRMLQSGQDLGSKQTARHFAQVQFTGLKLIQTRHQWNVVLGKWYWKWWEWTRKDGTLQQRSNKKRKCKREDNSEAVQKIDGFSEEDSHAFG